MATVLEVIQATRAYLAKHGVENPRLNSEHLLAYILGQKRIDLYLGADRLLAEAELNPLRELVRRRARREPLQHLLGTVEFFGRTFSIDSRALIPRPETEQLVEFILARPFPPEPSILDVGTGSGIIALTLAVEIEKSAVTAIDISGEALELARHNARKLVLEQRVTFLQGDLLEGTTGAFDLIVANLPYIPTDVLHGLAQEVRHDPKLALDGGADGLSLITRLLCCAPSRLNSGGLLALEIGHDQSERLIPELQARGYQDIQCKEDYQGAKRFLFAMRA